MVVREVEKRDGWSDEAGEGEAGAVFWFVGCISAEPADGEEEEVVDWAKRRCEHGELGMFWKDAGFFQLTIWKNECNLYYKLQISLS